MIISSSCKNVKIASIFGYKLKNKVESGDILLANVMSIGNYGSIETITGKLKKIKTGDFILVTQGNRYATQEQEIVVSNKNLVLGSLGGVVGGLTDKRLAGTYTKLKIVGYAIDKDNNFLNLKNFFILSPRLRKLEPKESKSKVIVVMGGDMNTGKTTCATYLVKKFTSVGKIVNYGKITGTTRLKDLLKAKKDGANIVVDFTDCGYSTTYKSGNREVEEIINRLYLNLIPNNPDYIILEMSDGILQDEVKVIIKKRLLNKFDPEIYFCCRDSLSVGEAIRILKKADLQISFVSGIVTNSNLAIKEIENNFGIKCLHTEH